VNTRERELLRCIAGGTRTVLLIKGCIRSTTRGRMRKGSISPGMCIEPCCDMPPHADIAGLCCMEAKEVDGMTSGCIRLDVMLVGITAFDTGSTVSVDSSCVRAGMCV
jgi:hypothetical protein